MVQESEFGFTEVNGKDYADLVAPTLREDLVRAVTKDSVILVSSDISLDKNTLLRSVASQLYKADSTLEIREWHHSSGFSSLFNAIRTLKKQSILIIDQLNPGDIQFDFKRLIAEIRKGRHYLLASSVTSKKAWHLDYQGSSLFHEISESDVVYEEKAIRNALQQKLAQDRHQYKFEITNAYFNAGNVLSGTLKVKDLARYFTLPEQIDTFIRLLSQRSQVIHQSDIEYLAKRASEEQTFSLSSWFGPLEDRQKLGALAMTLFEGLTEDQFFSSVQRLNWGNQDYPAVNLQALDYKDILPLLNVFKLESVKTADGLQQVIVGRYPRQQELLIDAIWFSHRRYLIRSIPTIVELVIGSIEDQFGNRELYGTRSKRERIRRVAGQLLSCVGRKSWELVESALLQLASHRNIAVQSVAAYAMAEWHKEPAENEEIDVLHLLEKWRTDTHFLDVINRHLDQRNGENDSASTYIKATLIITLGYAAQYGSPGNRNDKLLKLLFSFLKDGSTLIRKRLNHALPYVIRTYGIHMSQEEWERLYAQIDLVEGAGSGLVWGWRDNPTLIEKYLLKNLQDILVGLPANANVESLQIRDQKAGFFIVCLGLLMHQQGVNVTIDKKEAGVWLWQLRDKLDNPSLKQLVWVVHLSLGALPHGIYEQLELQLSSISKEEESLLLQKIGEQYVKERSELTGGDDSVRRGNQVFETWIDNDREETAIEKLMYKWLLGETSTGKTVDKETIGMLQQIGFMSFQEFSKAFDYWESGEVKALLKAREKEKELASKKADEFVYDAIETAMIPLNQGALNKLWDSLFGDKRSRLIRALKNILRQSPHVDRNMMLMVVQRWKKKDDEFEKVAKQIEKTLN